MIDESAGPADEVIGTDDALALLERCGAMLGGHFRLSSGRHSDRYVEKARLFEDPAATTLVANAIASWYDAVHTVVAPAVGAVPLGFAVALAAGARSMFAERDGGRMVLRRGFVLRPGERTLVVEDVITTGASAREVLDLVTAAGADALGVAAVVDRSTEPVGFPLRTVVRVLAASWDPGLCPLCRRGEPVTERGSRYLLSRPGEGT